MKSSHCLLLLALSFFLGCTADPYVYVESANQNSRIDYIVIHATSENFAESLRLLTTRTSRPVSAHYLIPQTDDPTYPRNTLRVHSLVPEHQRAWHAGVSHWGEETGLNDRSIGIELVNEFECTAVEIPVALIQLEDVQCEFLPYDGEQITLLIDLLKSILGRYPNINPIDIVGHSDIATRRRSDPGPLFPWHQLYEEGIGAWPDPVLAAKYRTRFLESMPSVLTVQAALVALGYEAEVSGEFDTQTQFAVRAFQLHFRPRDYSGIIDLETLALLWALLEEYKPWELDDPALRLR